MRRLKPTRPSRDQTTSILMPGMSNLRLRVSQAGNLKQAAANKAQSFPDVRAPEIEPAEKPIAAASKVESLQTCSMVLIIVVAAAFILGIRNRRG